MIATNWRGIGDANGYVELARKKNGPLPGDRDAGYVWGDALAEFDALNPDLRLINLETAITAHDQPWPEKSIHYRMHPRNVGVLTRARIDFCALANNHVLDWGYPGLEETMETLDQAGIRHAGAGLDRGRASEPVNLDVPGKGRVIVVSMATPSSHIAPIWAAGRKTPGINLIGLNHRWLEFVKERVANKKHTGDILVISIHWGPNFSHEISPHQREFARRLIHDAGVDIVHGHSSHHVKGIEIYNGKLILYGCGDFINDYEGIPKSPERSSFAPHLGSIYFARVSTENGRLIDLEMRSTRMHRLQVRRGTGEDADRLCDIYNQEGAKLGTRFINEGGVLSMRQPSLYPKER